MAGKIPAKKWSLGKEARADWGEDHIDDPKGVWSLEIIDSHGRWIFLTRSQMRLLYVGLSSLYKD